MNTLYYGDNLKILREYVKTETVDLVYLDPPFNSNRNYNVLFKDESGAEAESQITAFEDTWHWHTSKAEQTYHELVLAGDDVSKMIEAFRSFIGTNQMTAYLVMMAIRLKELHRVLKETGSLYLHCDPTASHYLKILLDTIFGSNNFQNEIIWRRTTNTGSSKSIAKSYPCNSDVILFYTKSDNYFFEHFRLEYSDKYKSRFNKKDERGIYYLDNLKTYSQKRFEELKADNRIEFTSNGKPRIKNYLHEGKGVIIDNIWDDIQSLNSQAAERLGYPTQKPVALLKRIIEASSNKGDVVLDPFCGCGTTIAAAQELERQWIGIDITHLSIALQKFRLKDSFGLEPKGRNPRVSKGVETATEENTLTDVRVSAYQIIGEPEDLHDARQLALEDRYQFQWWALSLIKARPLGASAGSKAGKKGADKGIDGVIPFFDDKSGKSKRVLVQVKSGKVKSGDIRDLVGTIDRENAAIGVFLTLEKPSKDMKIEAASAGFYHSEYFHRDFPRIQILTIEDLFDGREVLMPTDSIAFKQAEKVTKNVEQLEMF